MGGVKKAFKKVFSSVASVFGLGAPAVPKLPPPPEVPDLAAAERSVAEDKKRSKAAALIGGRSSNIRTSPLGVVDKANVGTKTLLGQ